MALQARIRLLAEVSTDDLIERATEAIAGSDTGARWSPTSFVYEPAITYRIVPVVARRAMLRAQGLS